MPKMRAKLYVSSVKRNVGEAGQVTSEQVEFYGVSKSGSYPADGLDEDNTYAKFSPQAHFAITIANPALFESFVPGQRYYVDFTAAE